MTVTLDVDLPMLDRVVAVLSDYDPVAQQTTRAAEPPDANKT